MLFRDTLYTSLHPEVSIDEYILFCCSDCYEVFTINKYIYK